MMSSSSSSPSPSPSSPSSSVRSTFLAAIAAVLSVAAASVPPAESHAIIPPNLVGTWRLDSLLDQAQVSGVAPSDVDPSAFVLHDLRFAGMDGGVTALASPFGEGKVVVGDGCLRLEAKGTAANFRIPMPRDDSGEFTPEESVGMVALRIRSSDVGDVALLRNLDFLGGAQAMLGGFQGMPQMPGLIIPMGAPAGGAPPPGFGPPPNGPPGGPVPAPPPNAPPNGPPGLGGPGMRGGPGAMNFDPRPILAGNTAKFEADGEWHSIARTRRQLGPGGIGGGMFMGGPNLEQGPLEEIVLVVMPPKDKKESGVAIEIEFVHVLDAKADYASKPAAPCSVERDGVTHCGMYMNMPIEATWRLAVPEGGRFLAGLTALDDSPFELYVHVTADGARKTVLAKPHESGDEIAAIDVDLSAYAGKEIALTLEAVEEEEPTVAFVLQPIVYGRRKDEVRNVFLYFCDTLRADGLSSYGNPRATTPHLDAIAAEGIRFERCYSQGAWTYVSMPASLSGMYPSVNGVKAGGERVADSVETMAEAFRNAGYLTAAFIRNDFVGTTTNTQQGFDFFFPGNTVLQAGQEPAQQGLQNVVARLLGRNSDAAMLGGGNIFGSGSSRDLARKSQPWIEKYADVPFFLYLHAVDPHDPYDPEKADMNLFLTDEERKRFDDEEQKVTTQMTRGFMAQQANAPAPAAPTPAEDAATGAGETTKDAGAEEVDGAKDQVVTQSAPNPAAGAAPAPRMIQAAGPPRPGDFRDQMKAVGIDADAHVAMARALYDAEIVYFDRHLLQIVETMKAKGLWDELVFSFNADHGEEFLDHGGMGHGQSVYAELGRVPWILRAPGLVKPGVVVKDSVANVDLAPTLLGLCGAPIPESMQGRNLVEALRDGDELPAVPIFMERWGGGIFGGAGGPFGGGGAGDFNDESGDQFLGQWAVIERNWKTIVTRSLEPARGADGAVLVGADNKKLPPVVKVDLEIYDLDQDLKDEHSLIATERPRAEAAAKRLETWLREMKKLNARYANEDTTSDDAAAALRALGYAQ